jgi:hypothetical protein
MFKECLNKKENFLNIFFLAMPESACQKAHQLGFLFNKDFIENNNTRQKKTLLFSTEKT